MLSLGVPLRHSDNLKEQGPTDALTHFQDHTGKNVAGLIWTHESLLNLKVFFEAQKL